jgi:hypothetical protein
MVPLAIALHLGFPFQSGDGSYLASFLAFAAKKFCFLRR